MAIKFQFALLIQHNTQCQNIIFHSHPSLATSIQAMAKILHRTKLILNYAWPASEAKRSEAQTAGDFENFHLPTLTQKEWRVSVPSKDRLPAPQSPARKPRPRCNLNPFSRNLKRTQEVQHLSGREWAKWAGNGFFFTSGEFLHLLSNKIVNFPHRVASEIPAPGTATPQTLRLCNRWTFNKRNAQRTTSNGCTERNYLKVIYLIKI